MGEYIDSLQKNDTVDQDLIDTYVHYMGEMKAEGEQIAKDYTAHAAEVKESADRWLGEQRRQEREAEEQKERLMKLEAEEEQRAELWEISNKYISH